MSRRRASRGSALRRMVVLMGRLLGWTLKMLLFVGFLCGLGYGLVSFATTSDHFRVKWIRVEGINLLDEATIRDGCGITQESNLIFLKPAEIREKVEKIPYVLDCVVTCVFPDTVVIRITERQAIASLMVRDRLYALDKEGRVLQEISPGSTHPGPLIGAPPRLDEVTPGDNINMPAYPDALAVWDAFSKTQAGQKLKLSEISARASNDIEIFFDDVPYKMVWGRGNAELQARRLDILWEAKGGNLGCQDYLDLRFDEDLVCR